MQAVLVHMSSCPAVRRTLVTPKELFRLDSNANISNPYLIKNSNVYVGIVEEENVHTTAKHHTLLLSVALYLSRC